MTPVLIGVAVGGAVLLFLLGLSRVMASSGSLEERLESWVQGTDSTDLADLLKEEGAGGSLLGSVDEAMARQTWAESMKEDLAQADLTITVTEYLLIRVAAIVVLFLVGYFLQSNFLVGLVLGAVGFVAPIIYVRVRQGRRLRSFNGQLPDVLDHLQGSLRAGYGLLQSVEWVSRQIPNPAGMEFDRVVREVQLGRNILEALDSMVRRIPSDDLSLIATAIKIQYEVGGSLAEILEIVAHTIRERVRIQREISVLTAQQRISGYVLMVLPFGMAIFLFVVNPEYIMTIFEPGPFLCIPIGTLILMGLGFLIMRRIIDIEV